MRRSQALSSILGAFVALAVFACSGDPGRLSSAPDWAGCIVERDCTNVPGAVACQDGFCVDGLGKRIPAPSTDPGDGLGGAHQAGGGSSGSSGQAAGGMSAGAGGDGAGGAAGVNH